MDSLRYPARDSSETGLVIDAKPFAQWQVRLLAHVVIDGADQAVGMTVIGDDEDERVIAALGGPVAGELHGVVEHDHVIDGTVHVEQMRILVDHAGLDHQDKSLVVARQHVECGLHLFGQIGLLRIFPDAATLQELAVEHAVHIAGRE